MKLCVESWDRHAHGTYPPETVVAEKVEAMIHLGSLNSRKKGFYDVWRIARQFSFDGESLCRVIAKTFGSRKTEIIAFEEIVIELKENSHFQKQWAAFLNKTAIKAPVSFNEILNVIDRFISPVLNNAKDKKILKASWQTSGIWDDKPV